MRIPGRVRDRCFGIETRLTAAIRDTQLRLSLGIDPPDVIERLRRRSRRLRKAQGKVREWLERQQR